MSRITKLMRQVMRLAWLDLWLDKSSAWLRISAVVGVTVPLLFLEGIKEGYYSSELDNLLSNPKSLRIVTEGEEEFYDADIEKIRAWPGVRSAALRTRWITASGGRVRAVESGNEFRAEPLVPSGPNDPRIGIDSHGGLGKLDIALGYAVANKIDASPGDRVELIVKASGNRKPLTIPLTLKAIVPVEYRVSFAALLSSELMDLVEAYYDGYAIPSFDSTDGKEIVVNGKDLSKRVVVYEGVEVYVDNIEDVGRVIQRLEDRGVSVRSRNVDIDDILNLDWKLRWIMFIVMIGILVGLCVSFVTVFSEASIRKRVTFSTLAQLGMPRWSRRLIPVTQATVIGICGLFVSGILTVLIGEAMELIGVGRGGTGGRVLLLSYWHVVILAGVLLSMFGGSWWGFSLAQRKDPANDFRER